MPYTSETVANAVYLINKSYFLPAFQREYVWKSDQVIKLFDSILRGYPISSFLFWRVNEENRGNWQIYKFIEHASCKGVHSDMADIHGVRDLSLVLDGQQRLTSLYVGMRGTYAICKKGKPKAIPDRYRLYMDLLKKPGHDADAPQTTTYYGLEFKKERPQPSTTSYWYPIGEILDLDSEERLESFIEVKTAMLPPEARSQFGRNIRRLYSAVHVIEAVSYYTETNQELDTVLDIFIRANEGGTKLSKSDLLFSMITSHWGGMDARQAIFSFIDQINTRVAQGRINNFDKDFVMKSFLVLSNLPVVYKVQNFTVNNLVTIRNYWNDIQLAIRNGVALANSLGINESNLTSVNALMPIILFMQERPHYTFLGNTLYETKNRKRMHRWLTMSLVNGAFGRASDSLLTNIRAALRGISPQADFPIGPINDIIARTGLAMDMHSFENELLAKKYGQQQAFLAMTLLYDDINWGDAGYNIDHLFPTHAFVNFPQPQRDAKDRLANLGLLLPRENQGRQDMPLDEWLAEHDDEFLRRHLIPQERRLWRTENCIDFWQERELLIRGRIEQLFGQ